MEIYATQNNDCKMAVRKFPEHEETGFCRRDPFQRDRDRILHSRAFRRMMHKTQIFNANMGDHYRNRLTHTLEVSQISRSIGKCLGLNDELIEAIALGHDLGHTPYGHIGERTLDSILQNGIGIEVPGADQRFKHNFQSLKVVDQLETRCQEYSGINLTLATREGILKHTKTFYNVGESALIYPEVDFTDIDLFKPSFTLEGQVVAIADEIAQCTHDIEDGVRSKILVFDDIRNFEIISTLIYKYEIRFPNTTLTPTYDTRNLIIKNLIGYLIEDVVKESKNNIQRYIDKYGTPQNNTGFDEECIAFSTNVKKSVKDLLDGIKRLIISSDQITIADVKSFNIIKTLFTSFYLHPKQLPDYVLKKYCKQKEMGFDRLQIDDSVLQQDSAFLRTISDHIAGMTDQYASRTFALLSFPEYI